LNGGVSPAPYPTPIPLPAATAGDVLALVRDGRAATRSEIGRLTGLSRTAVAARVATLIGAGLVVEAEEAPSSGGRPPMRLRFNDDAGVVLAAAIGRSRTQLAVCDLSGRDLVSVWVDQEIGSGPDELMPRLVARLGELLEEAGRSTEEVRAFGVSIPGAVDVETGRIVGSSPVMAGWDDVDLAPVLRELAEAPVYVENDANAMVLSERHAHLDEFNDLIMVKASTGLGAGIVTGGRLLRGALGAAGEIGHTKTPAAEGRTCRCGDTGCVEAVAGGWALVQELGSRGRQLEHVRALVGLALDGDAEARHLVRESGRRVGQVLAGAINLLNPEAVVIGGDMAGAYDVFVAGLRETVYAHATALATRELQILPSTHGDRAGVVGCAAMALEQVLSPGAVDRVVSG
jgi:predicted NBD/HSP70 family sugar kinase